MLTEPSRLTDFPTLASQAYLNTAAEGIPPTVVIRAFNQYCRDKLLGMDGRPKHEVQRQRTRELAARFLGLSPQEIGICSCSSEAFNLAATAAQLGVDDEVVINDLDFPSGATPWLVPTCPATTRLWAAREGALRLEDLTSLLGPRTRLVSLSLVSFLNGYRLPLNEIARQVHRHCSALLVVDVTQALGRIPLDLSGADLIISSTHKWILASHGGGLVGVPQGRTDEWTARVGGWFNRENAFAPDRFERAPTRPGADSYTVGMPNYPAIYAVAAGLEYIESVGVAMIDDYCRPLVRYCLDEVKKLPVELLTPDEPDGLAGILAFRHHDAERIQAELQAQNIHIMSHAGRLRVAIHGYNTAQDIEKFIAALQETLNK